MHMNLCMGMHITAPIIVMNTLHFQVPIEHKEKGQYIKSQRTTQINSKK